MFTLIVLWTVTTIMAIAITAGVMSHNRQEETNKFLLESCRILNGRVTTCESTIRRLVAALEKIPEAPNATACKAGPCHTRAANESGKTSKVSPAATSVDLPL